MHVITPRSFCAILIAAAMANHAIAADGDLDPDFGDGGFRLSGILDAYPNPIAGTAVQADGKILICGSQAAGVDSSDFYVARFTADGELDTSFSFDGRTTVDFDGGDDICTGLAVQPDGKIVIVGTSAPHLGSNGDFAIARLNSDGTLDTAGFGNGSGKSVVAFDLGGNNSDQALAVALRPNGRIVVAGSASTASNGMDFAILQLNTDGSRDTAFNLTGRVTVGFNLGGIKDDQAQCVAIDAAGRIIAAGFADHGSPGGLDMAVVRLLPNGQPDPDFSADGRATLAFDLGGANGNNHDQAIGMIIDRQERIVLSGAVDSSPTSANDPQAGNLDIAVARLQPDGSPDATFGIGGKTVVSLDLAPNGADYGFSLLEQGNGRLLVAGTSLGLQVPPAYEYGTVIRLRPDGLLDPTFGTVGKRLYDFEQSMPSGQLFNGIAAQGSKIVLAGALNVADLGHADFMVARVTDDLIFADWFE
jgi:uncharacterized delta-60 repeat protein